MTTKEIVKALPKNQVLRMIVPDWAHPTIPFPFFKNGIPCLGFYFYPMKNSDAKHQIQAPIIQVISVYPAGHIIGITAAPFFMNDNADAKLVLGEYPNTTLKTLSLKEGNALYDEYYAACDALLEKKDAGTWKRCFENVKEEGMDKFFAIFSSYITNTPAFSQVKMHSNPQATRDHSEIRGQNHLSARMRHIIRDIQCFLNKPVFAKEAQELTDTVNAAKRSEYSVAVIGEFSRGKTTFLNNLLGLDCLPVGDLPTTAVLTKIRNGTAASATFINKAKKISQFALSSENLERFLADDKGNDPEGVLQISTPVNWLGENRIVFLDTPGAGDIVGKRADITRRTISYCDSTIMTISAQAACSMTELAFLRENVLLKAVPHCSILITKLDTVPQDERMKVIAFVKDKIQPIMPQAEYWVANEMDGIDLASLDACGIKSIQERIMKQGSSDDIEKRREIQLTARIQSILTTALTEIKMLEDAEKLSDEEKTKTISKLKHNRENLELIKQELLTKCEAAQYTAERDILAELDECKANLLKDLKMSLQKSVNTKEWVEKDFSYMMEKAIKPIMNRLEKKIICSVSNDRIQLGNAVKAQLSTSSFTVTIPEYDAIPIDANLDFSPENIEKKRLISRCATVAAMPIALLVLSTGGLAGGAMLVSGGLGIASEFFLKGKIDEQKKQITEQLEKHIATIFYEIQEHLREYIAKCYAELIAGLNIESEKAINNAISKINTVSQERENSAKESSALREQITNLLESIK